MSAFDEQNEHVRTREQMAARLAGGISGEELARFQEHVMSCAECGTVWEEIREVEGKLTGMFESARADEGLEDRVIQRLRSEPARRRWFHPSISFAATGIAATIVLGGFGFMVNRAMERGGMVGLDSLTNRQKVASNLRQIGQTLSQYSNENKGIYGWPTTRQGSGPGWKFNERLVEEFGIAGVVATPEEMAQGSVNRGAQLFRAEAEKPKAVDQDTDARKLGAGGVSAGIGVPRYGFQVPALSEPNLNEALPPIKDESGVVVLGGSGDVKDSDRARRSLVVKDAKVVRGGESAEKRFYFSDNFAAESSERKPARVETFKPMDKAKQLGTKRVERVEQKVEDQSKLGETRMFRESLPYLKSAKAPASVEVAMGDANPSPQPSPAGSGEGGKKEGDTSVAPTKVEDVRAATRKIIRNGVMEFEVDRFDSAFAIVSKVTNEAGGYVGSTNSEKLPNGKVKGSVVVRIPPERLDTVVLSLRSLGELKSQKLEAQDISKHYQDLDSELTADRAMEARLLEIIKSSKGQIKDLLAAEKELATWRGKIEKIVGEMKYFDNMVSMSTLSLTLYERDIKTAAAAIETETIDAGVETSDVEKARADALKAIEEAKGRVVQSDLKRFEAGQFAATIVAEVSPDRAGPLLDRIKQLGKMARLDVQRKQTSSDGAATRVERKETRFNISLYNLANVAPRVTTSMNLAAEEAEGSYRAILARVEKAGGRVVTSNLDRKPNAQVSGTIGFEVPTAEADALVAEVKSMGEVLKLTVTENPDVNNVTTAKRGFTVQLYSASGVAPRETAVVQVAATKVAEARNAIALAAEALGARVLSSSLNEQDRQNVTANVDLEVKRPKLAEFEKAVAAAGDVLSRNVSRSNDAENTIDSKVRIQLSLVGVDKIPARQTTMLAIEVGDVDAAVADLQSAASSAGAMVAMSNLSKDRSGRVIGRLVLEAPLSAANELTEHAKKLGTVRVFESTKNEQAPEGKLAKARIELTLANGEAIVRPENGVWASVRNALGTSAAGLLWSLQIVIVGLCFVLPWVALFWGGWRVWKRRGRRDVAGRPRVNA